MRKSAAKSTTASRTNSPPQKRNATTKRSASSYRAAPSKRGTTNNTAEDAPTQQIDARPGESNDWRGELLARVRALILQADPNVIEEVKWRKPSNAMAGVPVWSHHGIICTGETYKSAVKLTFAKGASLDDPAGLFNAGLEGNTRRAIDFHKGDKVNAKALQALIRAAVALNTAAPATARPARIRVTERPKRT